MEGLGSSISGFSMWHSSHSCLVYQVMGVMDLRWNVMEAPYQASVCGILSIPVLFIRLYELWT